MYKHKRQNSRTSRTRKIFNEVFKLTIDCYEHDDIRNLEEIIVALEDASLKATILLREIEANKCLREYCKYYDYCK